MSESKYTPGPWQVYYPFGHSLPEYCFWVMAPLNVNPPIRGAGGGYVVAEVADPEAGVEADGTIVGVNRANAHLIAAAPDLLEAARACQPYLERYVRANGPWPNRRLEALQAAIAKAEGVQL